MGMGTTGVPHTYAYVVYKVRRIKLQHSTPVEPSESVAQQEEASVLNNPFIADANYNNA